MTEFSFGVALALVGRALASETAKSAVKKLYHSVFPLLKSRTRTVEELQESLSARLDLVSSLVNAIQELGLNITSSYTDVACNLAMQMATRSIHDVLRKCEKLERKARSGLMPVNVEQGLRDLVHRVRSAVPCTRTCACIYITNSLFFLSRWIACFLIFPLP